VSAERVVRFRLRSVAAVVALLLAVWALLHVLSVARHVVTWFLIALFLAMAINPLVEVVQRRLFARRGPAVAAAYLLILILIAVIGLAFVPTLVHQVNDFAQAVPGYIDDITKGRGRLGFLETKYHIVQKVHDAVQEGGAAKIFGLTGTTIAITKSVLAIVAGVVTIVFLTLFMLLEGPTWVERLYGLLPAESQPRWRRVGLEVYRTVAGYVTGNLLISVIAGVTYGIVLLVFGVPYAVALALLVAILDLVPLVGATVATVIVGAVAFLHSIPAGIAIVVYAIVYQQVENHILQPVIYSRTVQLTPLTVLLAVLVGAALAGVLGALGAIPVAGTIQVLLADWRRSRIVQPTPLEPPPQIGSG
jgi:predicted PurR-regulated permease PerM